MPIGALAQADEAFLSSTTREVQPIAHVDGVALREVAGAVSTRSPPRSAISSRATSIRSATADSRGDRR